MLAKLLEAIADLVNPLIEDPIDVPDGSKRVPYRDGNTTRFQTIPGDQRLDRSHAFHDFASFAAWLKRETAEGADDVDILVAEGMGGFGLSAGAVLENYRPESEFVTAVQRFHPLYLLAIDLLDRKMSQKDIYAALRPLIASIVQADGTPEADAGTAPVHPGENLHASIQSFVVSKGSTVAPVGNTGTVKISVQIPETFVVRVPVYRQIEPTRPESAGPGYDLKFILELDLDQPEPMFKLSCPTLPLVIDDAMRDAIDMLKALLGEGFLVGRGRIQVRTVRPE